MVLIIYENGTEELIAGENLQSFLEVGTVVRFRRADGWVYPGLDPVRRKRAARYCGPERRQL